MKFQSFLAASAVLSLTSAHFHVVAPEWRGDSFARGASQWLFPCANVSETADPSNRTQWPVTGGSVAINGSHDWALTYVNLGLGTNVSSFNISLLDSYNQTGAGVFCLKEAGRAALEEGLAAAGLNSSSVDGVHASLQIIQIAHSGASLYNCADITFNASATLLSDDVCQNGTDVGGSAIQNVGASQTQEETPAESSGAASALSPAVGGGFLAAVIAWGLL